MTDIARPETSPLPGMFTLSLFRFRRRILVSMTIVVLLSVVIALLLPKKYRADAQLLAVLGNEYTYRPQAGEAGVPSSALDREQVLRTEVEIIKNPTLHRTVLQQIGIERLYPDPDPSQGIVTAARLWVKDFSKEIMQDLGLAPKSEAPGSQLEQALIEFDAHLSVTAVKDANTIRLSFTHRDPALAAEVLNTLIADYLDNRRRMFSQKEAPIVRAEVERLHADLDAATTRLTRFKAANDISNFSSRREILLHEQGTLEDDLAKTKSLIGASSARVDELNAKIAKLPKHVLVETDSNVDQRLSPLRTTIEGLRAKLSDLRTRYRDGSAPVQALHAQIAAREAELERLQKDRSPGAFRQSQNPIWTSLSVDLLRAQGELAAAQAHQERDQASLTAIATQLRDLDKLEQQLVELERQQQVLDTNYRNAAKILGDRTVIEQVDAHKQAGVRVLQNAVVPVKPVGYRRIVVLAGFVMALLTGFVVALISNQCRRFFVVPEELEVAFGLPVLSCVNDSRELRHEDVQVRPS